MIASDNDVAHDTIDRYVVSAPAVIYAVHSILFHYLA